MMPGQTVAEFLRQPGAVDAATHVLAVGRRSPDPCLRQRVERIARRYLREPPVRVRFVIERPLAAQAKGGRHDAT